MQRPYWPWRVTTTESQDVRQAAGRLFYDTVPLMWLGNDRVTCNEHRQVFCGLQQDAQQLQVCATMLHLLPRLTKTTMMPPQFSHKPACSLASLWLQVPQPICL